MESVREIYSELSEILSGKTPEEMAQTIEQTRRLMTCYRCAMLNTELKFKVLSEEFNLRHDRNPIENIKTRIKSMPSIREKLTRRGYPITLESIEQNMHDVAGVRVICSFLDDIYMLCDCLLKQDDVRLIEIKDYIKHPKPSGYRSLHMIIEIPIFLYDEKKYVKVEVQLRTTGMEAWANLEHRLVYKQEYDPGIVDRALPTMLECAEISAKFDERMQALRNIIETD